MNINNNYIRVCSILVTFLVLAALTLALTGCSDNSSLQGSGAFSSESAGRSDGIGSDRPSGNASGNSTNKRDSFTNKYGTATTKCAHPGCDNNIASSGDTNCCTVHSNKCLECGKYIDEDAMYCISCLSRAANQSSPSSGGSGGKVTGSGAGCYDMPNENDESFSDYVKRVDPELYDSLFN